MVQLAQRLQLVSGVGPGAAASWERGWRSSWTAVDSGALARDLLPAPAEPARAFNSVASDRVGPGPRPPRPGPQAPPTVATPAP